MPVTMPGSAMGSTNSTVSASLPESGARQRERRERAEHQRDDGRAGRDAQRQRQRLPDVRALEGALEPAQREPRRRELVGAIFGGERVQDDDQHRDVHERQAGEGADARSASEGLSGRYVF